MPTLALIRHGQSLWNSQNRFTGWVDVPLTPQGETEARQAGRRLQEAGHRFDIAYTSGLTRAHRTLDLVMQVAGLGCPVIRDAALNERHYGDLQGLDKARTADEHGEDQVRLWRRSYDTSPPNGESLAMTAQRVLPFYERAILGDVGQGLDVLVVAHGNSNRALVMRLEDLDPDDVPTLELATGVPRVYDLARDGSVRSVEVLDLPGDDLGDPRPHTDPSAMAGGQPGGRADSHP